MGENNLLTGKKIFRWGMLSISLYLNFSGILAILFKLISLAVTFSHISVKSLIAIEVVSYILKLGLLILALVLINNRMSRRSIIKYPRRLAIASFILLPVVLLFQFAVQAGNTLLMSTLQGASYMGEYAMFSSVAGPVSSSLGLITVMIFGLVVNTRDV